MSDKLVPVALLALEAILAFTTLPAFTRGPTLEISLVGVVPVNRGPPIV